MRTIKLTLAVVVFLLTSSNMFGTDLVQIYGKKENVNQIYKTLKPASNHKNKDVRYEYQYNNGYGGDGSFSYIYLNGVKFGEVQLSNVMKNNVNTKFFNNPTSNVPQYEIINKYCATQSGVMNSLVNSLSNKIVVTIPTQPVVSKCNTCGPTVDLKPVVQKLDRDYQVDVNTNQIVKRIETSVNNLDYNNNQRYILLKNQINTENQQLESLIVSEGRKTRTYNAVGQGLNLMATLYGNYQNAKYHKNGRSIGYDSASGNPVNPGTYSDPTIDTGNSGIGYGNGSSGRSTVGRLLAVGQL